MEERLQKILARAGICSRRKAEIYIADGRVTVDGQTVNRPGLKVDPATAVIKVDNKVIAQEEKIYILLNKPAGFVTTLSDPQGRPIVTDLLPDISHRIFPVGRLDQDTEGALLLTNDGALANKIIHPRFEVNKTYVATVKGIPPRNDLSRLERGIMLDGHKTWPAKIRFLGKQKGTARIQIIIHEGRKRQVRKMFQAIGYPVLRLKRTAYGSLNLANLEPGKYRFLSEKALKKIFY